MDSDLTTELLSILSSLNLKKNRGPIQLNNNRHPIQHLLPIGIRFNI